MTQCAKNSSALISGSLENHVHTVALIAASLQSVTNLGAPPTAAQILALRPEELMLGNASLIIILTHLETWSLLLLAALMLNSARMWVGTIPSNASKNMIT